MTVRDESKGYILPFPPQGDRLVIPYSRGVAIYNLLCCTAFGAIMIFVMIYSSRIEEQISVVLCLLFLGGNTIRVGKRARTSEPALVLDATGVRIPDISEHTIPWNDIREVKRRSLLIFFEVDDPERYTPPASTLRGKWLRFISHLGFPPIAFYPYELQGRTKNILTTIERYRAQASEASSSGR